MTSRFESLAEAVTGGYARVQRVRDVATGEVVALKRPLAGSTEAVRQCAREIEVLSEVRHPHLVRLLDHGQDEQGWFAVLEWIEGESLEARLSCGRLPEPEARALLGALLSALQSLHAAGYTHGDVCAGNVMLAAGDHAVLIDLGNAVRLGERGAGLTGSLHAMAPERFEHAPASAAIDWYALGVLGYQALCGQLPFEGETKAQVIAAHHRHWRVPLRDRCAISAELADVIEGLISVRPDERAAAVLRCIPACSLAVPKES